MSPQKTQKVRESFQWLSRAIIIALLGMTFSAVNKIYNAVVAQGVVNDNQRSTNEKMEQRVMGLEQNKLDKTEFYNYIRSHQ